MHILISPNAFKNSLDAASAAEAIQKGLHKSSLHCTTACFPVGDGGDGTGKLLAASLEAETLALAVQDPLGRKIRAQFWWKEASKTAIIEMAAASGLKLLQNEELDPLRASSYGTGQLIREAVRRNAKEIILCIGGSATVDAGCGILAAMGVVFLDSSGNSVQPLPENFLKIASFDTSGLPAGVHYTILCDVDNPLLGKNGSAVIFGPQKGATPDTVQQLEEGLAGLTKLIREQVGIDLAGLPHGGAAGGVAAGLHAILGAKLVKGIDYFLEHTRFDQALAKADLLITGEGSIDLQTLEGKAPFGVALRAKNKGLAVVAFAGQTPAPPPQELLHWFDEIININAGVHETGSWLVRTGPNLGRAAQELGERLQKGSLQ